MFVVGLTGGIGSGKSEAARIFSQIGVPVVDVDLISHQLTAKGQDTLVEVIDKFGAEYLTADGSLNRAKLREKVFASDQARALLEAIMHPAIYKQAVAELEKNAQAVYQVLAVPLLFESPRYKNLVNLSLLIDCDESQQITRVMQRSGMTEADVKAIMSKQMSRRALIALADEVISNRGNLAELEGFILKFNQKMLLYLRG